MKLQMRIASLVLAILALPAAFALGQEQPLVSSFQGTHLFRNLLGVVKLQPITNKAEFAKLPASQTLLIVFGDLDSVDPLSKMRPGGLAKFVSEGGAILIASDRPDHGRLHDFKLTIPGKMPLLPMQILHLSKSGAFDIDPRADLSNIKRVSLDDWKRQHKSPIKVEFEVQFDQLNFPSEELKIPHEFLVRRNAEAYQGFDDCIKIHYNKGLTHPLFVGCKKGIATNRPSFILTEPGCTAAVLCSFPPFPGHADFEGMLRGTAPEPAFAVGSSPAVGTTSRLLLLAGHGQFMNGMLGQSDNDNLQFTQNILRWLTDNKQRKYCLFIEENQVMPDFAVPLGDLPLPTARIINDLMRGLQEENFFNRLLLENVGKQAILRVVLALTLFSITILGLQRVLRARFRQDNT
jgi:hypothetical protein